MMLHFPPAGGAVNIHLPSHVLHVSPAHVLDFIFALIVNGQVRANSLIDFHDGCAIDHQQLGGAGVLIVIREGYQTGQNTPSCANLRLQQLILTVSTAKLYFVSQSVSSLLMEFYWTLIGFVSPPVSVKHDCCLISLKKIREESKTSLKHVILKIHSCCFFLSL